MASSPVPVVMLKRRWSPPPLRSGAMTLALTVVSEIERLVMKLTTPAMASVP
ncbi:hypothetical protein [Massilia scottii]|uniref:hypothetical protein n=1 Tax=Massilia scottii TaxID=3057166 RepID=UPI00279683C4|nr:hypothetical protein [Massilia sp. CCM 9029]MDQ1832730.1 hypothetical protein [Massilia sp. CCM 9029]